VLGRQQQYRPETVEPAVVEHEPRGQCPAEAVLHGRGRAGPRRAHGREQNLGSLAGYCGTLIYLLASLAAPVWAYRRAAGSLFIVAAGAVGTGVMAAVFYYSYSLVPLPAGSARMFAYLFFGTVAVLFILGIGARLLRPQYLRRVGATEAIPGHPDQGT